MSDWRAQVSQTPIHHGDGYGWGGDWVLTYDGAAINLGVGDKARRLAKHIAALLNQSPLPRDGDA